MTLLPELIFFVILSLSDLLLSNKLLDPDLEANPIMSYIWRHFGFFGVAVNKIVWVLIFSAIVVKLDLIRSKYAVKIMYFAIGCLTIVNLRLIADLFKRC